MDDRPRHGGPVESVPPRTGRLLAAVTVPARPDSVPLLRRLAQALARRRSLSADVEEALALIVTELATNAVLHSGSPDVAVLFEVDAATLTVRVRDSGRWLRRRLPRCEAADVHVAFGRGLSLVNAYAVDTTVHCTDGGTVVQAVVIL